LILLAPTLVPFPRKLCLQEDLTPNFAGLVVPASLHLRVCLHVANLSNALVSSRSRRCGVDVLFLICATVHVRHCLWLRVVLGREQNEIFACKDANLSKPTDFATAPYPLNANERTTT